MTLYAEDQPSLGTWQLRLNGFEEQPVDHYMRPFWQAALDTDVHQSRLGQIKYPFPIHLYIYTYCLIKIYTRIGYTLGYFLVYDYFFVLSQGPRKNFK